MVNNIDRFLDKNSKVKIWPSKKDKKIQVLKYIAAKFEDDRIYNEKEINSIINDWHTFNDYFLIRRELIDYKLFSRTTNGSAYQKAKT